MGKLVSSKGLAEFIETGKVLVVPPGKDPAKLTETPPSAEKPAETPPPAAPAVAETATPASKTDDEALTEEEKALPEKAQKEIQRAKRAVNEKHRLMKEAQEEREELERLAESQYNERRLAEQARDKYESRIKELEAQLAPKASEIVEPVETDPKYKDAQGNFLWKDFSRDQAKYESDKAVRAERQRLAEVETQKNEAAKAVRLKASADEARKVHADYDDKINSVRGTELDNVPKYLTSYLEDGSQIPALLLYHLISNPQEIKRISELSPIRGIAELGKLEASLIKPSPVANAPATPGATAVTSHSGGTPPAPIQPLTGEGTTGITTDPSKMSFKQLREYERNRNKRR